MFTFLAILLAILGIYVLNQGIRGRRIDGHPHCAKCSFDLHGLSDALVCPECGVSVRGWSTRTIGTFRPRPRLIVAGGVILVVSVLSLTMLTLTTSGRINWYAKMPLWMLEVQAWSQPSSQSAILARQEFLSRAQGGLVPPERLGAFVVAALKPASTDERLQAELVTLLSVPTMPGGTLDAVRKWAFAQHANRSLPLSRELGEYLDQEFWSGRFDPEQMKVFLRNAVRPELVLIGPQQCASGDSLPLVFNWNWRGGNTMLVSGIDLPGVSFREELPAHFRSAGSFSSLTTKFTGTWRGDHIAGSAPGQHEIKGTATLKLAGQLFTMNAAQSPIHAGYPGGFQNIPPIILEFPISATYVVDATLTNSPADLARREIMRAIQIRLETNPVSATTPRRGVISISDECQPFTAEIAIEWLDGSTYVPFGTAVVASLDTRSTISFTGSTSAGRDGAYSERRPMEVVLGHSDAPTNVSAFRAHVRKIILHVKGASPSPLESFDLDFRIAPVK